MPNISLSKSFEPFCEGCRKISFDVDWNVLYSDDYEPFMTIHAYCDHIEACRNLYKRLKEEPDGKS